MTEKSVDLASTKVLVVGAGGIGCELLKNLVLSGFHDIEVVDMDTIELSNLNRQFLFRRRHIGKFKSEVAAAAVKEMNPDASVIAHVGNIMDTNAFPISFFQRFSIVTNALDNINARRYVNNMCLAVGIPLVESGTAGYLGQCTVILPRRTECYDCTGKQAPKTFAVCTIRSTPSAPIHCVVWAKDYLLSNLFGEEQAQESIPAEIEDSKHIDSLRKETEAFKLLRDMALRKDPELGEKVFDKIFDQDIKAICQVASLWEGKIAPKPIVRAELEIPASDKLADLDDHKFWTIAEWTALFMDSVNRLAARLPSIISFDKDDQDTLDFVTSVANLRAAIYGIPLTSKFSLKAMAGNIIPAIATTNAIAAGMVVLQAKNILAGRLSNLADRFITFDASRTNYFAKSYVQPPNPECSTCFVHRALLRCDPSTFTLGQVIDKVIPKFLEQIADPEVTTECLSVLEGSRMIYDEEDMPQGRSKSLLELGASDSKFLRFEFLEGLPLLMAIQKDDSYSADEFGCTFDVLPPADVKLGSKRSHGDADEDDDDDDFEVVDNNADDESDLEIIEPPTSRLKISSD